MASSTHQFVAFLCSILFFISPPFAQKSFRPKALFLPVFKDSSSLQYITYLSQRTPLVSQKLVVDLGGQYLWVDCGKAGYVSSSYRGARCGSIQCKLVNSFKCINNGTCTVSLDNTVKGISAIAKLGEDIVSIQSTNGYNPGRLVSVRKFLFGCAPTYLLEGLAHGVKGMAGLGRNKASFPSQFTAAFSFYKKFAICLSSSNQARGGAIFFGNGPYFMLPYNIDISKPLTYTPLIINPVSTAINFHAGERSSEYFIGVKSIKINGEPVKLNSTLLSINKEGYGGTKISTVHPYTVLETSIYNAVIKAFVKAMANISKMVRPVAPFGACFSSKNIGSTLVGPAVPPIDLVLQNQRVNWRIFGANSVVQVRNNVLCLGFVDGGSNPRTSIVIGGYQLENNLLQFDIATSRLGFSSSLLFRQITCSSFNFTSNTN